ncbi:MAG: hypothetical protein ACI8Y7_000918 [Candidatus Woesearchaeota archaeon]|jgi:hypothetical protein
MKKAQVDVFLVVGEVIFLLLMFIMSMYVIVDAQTSIYGEFIVRDVTLLADAATSVNGDVLVMYTPIFDYFTYTWDEYELTVLDTKEAVQDDRTILIPHAMIFENPKKNDTTFKYILMGKSDLEFQVDYTNDLLEVQKHLAKQDIDSCQNDLISNPTVFISEHSKTKIYEDYIRAKATTLSFAPASSAAIVIELSTKEISSGGSFVLYTDTSVRAQAFSCHVKQELAKKDITSTIITLSTTDPEYDLYFIDELAAHVHIFFYDDNDKKAVKIFALTDAIEKATEAVGK